MAHIAVVDNHEADAASRLTHITVVEFTCHFNATFPQKEPWRLCLLPCAEKHCMLTMLHTKRLMWYFPLPHCRKTPPPGSNGRSSSHGCSSQKTSREPRTQCHSEIFNQQVRAGVLFRQGKPDPEAKRGSIPLLRGGNIFSSGDNIPQTQHNEKPRL